MLLSRRSACLVFALVLLSFAAQSELAQQVQRTYKKPYFLLYLTHSGYTWIGPLHILAVRLLRIDGKALVARLHDAISAHCATLASSSSWTVTNDDGATINPVAASETPWPALLRPFARMVILVTISITIPSLSWYCAVPLTSMTEVTSLYNSNAFWCLLLSVYLTRTERMEWRKGSAVVLACVGVVVITYGDSQTTNSESGQADFGSKLAGSLLALLGSVTYALYEVGYSRFVALAEVPIAIAANPYRQLQHRRSASGKPLMSSPNNRRTYVSLAVSEEEEDTEAIEIASRSPTDATFKLPSGRPVSDQAVYLAYANLVTAAIGVCTLSLLWIPIPFLHWLDIERFSLPPRDTLLPICGVVFCGVAYNAGFMVLLGQWGPIVASVGNLCTLVLVAAADVLLVGARLTFWTLSGSALIVGAFAVLAADAWNAD